MFQKKSALEIEWAKLQKQEQKAILLEEVDFLQEEAEAVQEPSKDKLTKRMFNLI